MVGPERTRLQPREKPQLIADELRARIISGELSEGDSLGHEPELVERFGVSRPSLREALRILEAEGLITVVRGAGGGVVVHEPGSRHMARTTAMVLASHNVSLADVVEARTTLEPMAVKALASLRARRGVVAELGELIEAQESSIHDPEAFGPAAAAFHERLVALAGNATLAIVAETLNDIVARAVTVVGQDEDAGRSLAVRRRGLRSQWRLLELIRAGDRVGAENYWRSHLTAVGRVILQQKTSAVADLL